MKTKKNEKGREKPQEAAIESQRKPAEMRRRARILNYYY